MEGNSQICQRMCCDRSVIPHGSIWAGKKVPNRNGERRFLRGGPDGDMLKVEDDSVRSHNHGHSDTHVMNNGHVNSNCPDGTTKWKSADFTEDGNNDDPICSWNPTTTSYGGEETKPKNMNTVFIIRVW